MATLDEIITLLRDLSPASLDAVYDLVQTLRARELPNATWSFDFLTKFNEATRRGMEIKVAEATCAGITRRALWEHPPMSGMAQVGYLVPVPTGLRHIKMKFAIGIRDGSELPADRYVAFRVLVNGWKLWSTVKSSRDWEEHEIKMPQLSSDVVRIEFITDSLGDNRWNWAVWGEPRLEGDTSP